MESYTIKNLTFSYPDSREKALKDVSLCINNGEFVTIFGKSGSGKSTLLRLLKPILSPFGEKSGTVYFEGKDVNLLDDRTQSEKIGFVLQNPDNGIVCDKVWHELAFGLESLSVENSEIRSRVAEMASYFGIQTWFDRNVSELSGGQKRLLNLASVMVMNPSVVILDEPESQLDPIAARDFIETLSRINRELGITVIVSEHRLENLLGVSDKVVALDKGEIVSVGTPYEAGRRLKEINSPLCESLPVPMRIYSAVENDFDCPISVREGRAWLEKMVRIKPICKFCHEERKKDKKGIAVKLSGVYFRYSKNSEDVVNNLSMTVYKGEKYAILGGNGTGKTTTLSLISGANKYNHGTMYRCSDKISVLPQDPSVLFVKKTVLDELYDVLLQEKISEEQKNIEICKIIELCGLSGLENRHPYDISGGEMQRLGLAKILLTKPEILLLDEPTKGLDAHFKNRLAAILDALCNGGMTVIMVSHDVEFCAEYADRCAMFFRGNIVSENTPRKFFSGKNFYTTSANRMSRGIICDAVLTQDVILALGGKIQEKNQDFTFDKPAVEERKDTQKGEKKFSIRNIVIGSVFAILFVILALISVFGKGNVNKIALNASMYACLGLTLNFLLPQKRLGKQAKTLKSKKTSWKNMLVTLISLVLMVITVYVGNAVLDDRKYYFISLLLILEGFLAFALCFEGRKPKGREIVTLSVMCAVAVCGRSAFFMLSQFKPVAAIVIISGVCLGAQSGFVVGAMTGFVSNFFFGQGPWTPWQMFAFGLIGFLAGIVFNALGMRKTRGTLCIFGFLSTLVIYGGLLNTSYVLMGSHTINFEAILSSIALGFPFDLIHAFSTLFFLWFLAPSMIEKLDRLKTKYGLMM